DDETARIYLLIRKAEELLGAFADIEFACTENDEIYLLQARPITGIEQAKLIILDNTNIVESFPEISLPLSYSFASLTYEKVFRASLSAFGISDNQLENSNELFPNLLAHFKGRIYYRLDNWYKLVNQVYPSSSLKKSWRDAVGLIESENLSKNISLSHKIKVWTRILYLLLTYRFWTRRFFIAFDKLYLHFRSWKSQSLTPVKLWGHFSESIEKGLESWPYTLLNDYLAFALVGWVKKAANQLGVLPENTGEEELFPGNEEMESRQAVMHFNGLLAIITADVHLSQSFQSQPADKLLEIIEDAKHPSLTKAWKNYIERFGDRALAELKMETQTPRVNPVVLIEMIQSHLHLYSSNQLNFKPLQFDSNAGLALIRKRFHPLHPLYYPLKFLIRITSKGLSNRENMRFCRARIFGASREIFLEFGRLLAEKKIIAVKEDVFYLELSDIESFAKGNNQPLFQKVEARKLEYASFSDLTPPDRIIFEEGKDFWVPLIQGSEENSEGILRGTGVSKGSCEAEAIILLKPDFNQVVKGKILVTKMTDPGWVFLMSQAAGIISERGSLLSHTAIIGRELGIPVIVGVENATRLIQNGQRISIDGLLGTIQIMES
ncbi:MAG: hypothetical protein K9I34_07135, partial [Bacteroidales bacterium]|nr:hypothetical protein [Bacteroidales bacterium]